MKFGIVIVSIIIVVAGFILFSPHSSTQNSGSALSFQTVQHDVVTGGQLLDVRTPAEYIGGHIAGATNFSLQDMHAGQTPNLAKDKPVYLYCHSGSRASQAAVILKAAGYTNVTNLGSIDHVQAIGGIIKT